MVKNRGMDDIASIHLDIFAEKKTIGRACYAKVVQMILPLIEKENEMRETGDRTPMSSILWKNLALIRRLRLTFGILQSKVDCLPKVDQLQARLWPGENEQ